MVLSRFLVPGILASILCFDLLVFEHLLLIHPCPFFVELILPCSFWFMLMIFFGYWSSSAIFWWSCSYTEEICYGYSSTCLYVEVYSRLYSYDSCWQTFYKWGHSTLCWWCYSLPQYCWRALVSHFYSNRYLLCCQQGLSIPACSSRFSLDSHQAHSLVC